ncbi:MAG: hypothetical protein K9M82_02840 [Deltaproteobacteria bacterium]|nr:hypothetical protein [Deltaproteobacteria bacterium]
MLASRRSLWLLVLVPAVIFLLHGKGAQAHRVYVFAWVEGDTVYTESYFGGKRKAAGGTILVYDPAGREIVRGETNEEGIFAFPLPGRMDLRIVLEASTGHRAEYRLGADEIPGGGEGSPGPAVQTKQESTTRQDALGGDEAPGSQGEGSASVDAEAVRTVVEKALDERLNPLVRSVARLRQDQGPGVTEILGGIGYIVGLVGIYLYARSRRHGKGDD